MNNRCVVFGALLAVGTFSSSYTLVAVIIVFWALWLTWKNPRSPSVHLILLSTAVWFSAIWSLNPLMPIALGAIILSIGIVAKDVRSTWDINSFVLGMLVGVSPQIYAAFITWGEPRPRLLSLNASQLSQTGLMFWLIMPELPKAKQLLAFIPAAVQMGVGMARAPMIAGLVYLTARPSKQRAIMFAAIVAFFFFTGLSQGTLSRITLATTSEATVKRIELISGGSYDDTVSKQQPQLSLTGYGLGNYYSLTGHPRPHNVFLVLFYEMGILSAIPIFLLGWVVFTRKIPVSVFLALFLLWQVTEEAAGRVEGFFTTSAVLLAVWRTQPTTWAVLTAIRARLRLA